MEQDIPMGGEVIRHKMNLIIATRNEKWGQRIVDGVEGAKPDIEFSRWKTIHLIVYPDSPASARQKEKELYPVIAEQLIAVKYKYGYAAQHNQGKNDDAAKRGNMQRDNVPKTK